MENFFSLLQNKSIDQILNDINFNSYLKDKFFIFEILKREDFVSYDKVAPYIKNDPFLSLALLSKNSANIQYISKKLLNNKDFIIMALEHDINLAKVFHPQFNKITSLSDWFCWRYCSSKPLHYLPDHYNDNYNLAKKLVTYDSMNYMDLSERLKNKKDLYNISCNRQNMASLFVHAGKTIKKDKFLCTQAITHSYKLYKYVDDSLKNNPYFFINLLKLNHHFLELAPDSIRANPLCVLEAIKKDPQSLIYADPKLLNDYSFILKIRKNVSDIEWKKISRLFSNEIKSKIN